MVNGAKDDTLKIISDAGLIVHHMDGSRAVIQEKADGVACAIDTASPFFEIRLHRAIKFLRNNPAPTGVVRELYGGKREL